MDIQHEVLGKYKVTVFWGGGMVKKLVYLA